MSASLLLLLLVLLVILLQTLERAFRYASTWGASLRCRLTTGPQLRVVRTIYRQRRRFSLRTTSYSHANGSCTLLVSKPASWWSLFDVMKLTRTLCTVLSRRSAR
jgi:hypothetical protein